MKPNLPFFFVALGPAVAGLCWLAGWSGSAIGQELLPDQLRALGGAECEGQACTTGSWNCNLHNATGDQQCGGGGATCVHHCENLDPQKTCSEQPDKNCIGEPASSNCGKQIMGDCVDNKCRGKLPPVQGGDCANFQHDCQGTADC